MCENKHFATSLETLILFVKSNLTKISVPHPFQTVYFPFIYKNFRVLNYTDDLI